MRRTALAAIALTCLVAFFAAMAAALVPELHHFLHTDAAHAQHECAITIVESGKVQLSDSPVTVAAPQLAIEVVAPAALHPTWVPAQFLEARVFEHAPPALS